MKYFLSFLLLFILFFYNPGSVVANGSSFKTEKYGFITVKPTIANEPASSIFASASINKYEYRNEPSSIIKLSGYIDEMPAKADNNDQPTKNETTSSVENVILSDSTNVTGEYSIKLNTF